MSITGSLVDFSLPELFQFIEKGQKTGLLTLRAVQRTQAKPVSVFYIWVYQGRIVAAANRLDHQGLVSLIDRQQWISDRAFDRLVHWCCPITEPLGLYLKQQGVLQLEQLKRLFQIQVLQQLSALFQLKDAEFKFDPKVGIPSREMTGLSIPATEAALIGLRRLRNWSALAEQLPDTKKGLVSTVTGQPRQRLDALEWQVWEYTQGTVSLEMIAEQLRLPVEKVQQVAFRLIVMDLAEEVFLVDNSTSPELIEPLPEQLLQEAERQNVSHSFLHNLVGFLRSKV